MLRSVANLRDDCTGSGLRAVLEALPPPPAPREFREAGLEAGRGAGDVEAGRGYSTLASAWHGGGGRTTGSLPQPCRTELNR